MRRGNPRQVQNYGRMANRRTPYNNHEEEEDDYDPEAEAYHPAKQSPTPTPKSQQRPVRYYSTSMDHEKSVDSTYHKRQQREPSVDSHNTAIDDDVGGEVLYGGEEQQRDAEYPDDDDDDHGAEYQEQPQGGGSGHGGNDYDTGGADRDDAATGSTTSSDSEHSLEEEDEIGALEDILQLIVQYEEYKKQQVDSLPLRHPESRSASVSPRQDGSGVVHRSSPTRRGEEGRTSRAGTPRASATAPTTPRSVRGGSYHPAADNDAGIRSVPMDSYVTSLTEGITSEEKLPGWVQDYNQQQLEKHHSQGYHEQGGSRTGSVADEGGDDSAPNTGRHSVAPSTTYTRESSRFTTTSSKGDRTFFLSEEERQERNEYRRLRAEADVAAQRTFSPRLSRSGTPLRHQGIPLSKPGEWQDRLYGDYFADKMQKKKEQQLRMQKMESREEVAEFVRHCSFKPDLTVNQSYESSRVPTRGGVHLGNKLFEQVRDKQEEAHQAAETRRRHEREAAQKRAKTPVGANSPQLRIYDRGTRAKEHAALKREEIINSERVAIYRTQEEIDAKAECLHAENELLQANRDRLAVSLADGSQNQITFMPKISDYAAEHARTDGKPVHDRLYDESRIKQAEERRERMRRSEAETSVLTTGSIQRAHSGISASSGAVW